MKYIWLSFIPLLFLIYTGSEKKIKRLNKRIKGLEKTSERKSRHV